MRIKREIKWPAHGLMTGLSVLALMVSASGCAAASKQPPPMPAVAVPVIPAYTVNLAECGGVGDGQTLNTAAFEAAFEKLAKQGGGRLVVPPGIWFTGPIQLRSNTDLHLEKGALIQFSGDYQLYPLIVIDFNGEKEVDSTSPIHGRDLENVAITGEGVMDGGGDAWRQLKKSKMVERDWKRLVKSGGVLNAKGDVWYPTQGALDGKDLVKALLAADSLELAAYEPAHQFLRPKMVKLIGCKKILFEGVTFQNPPNWTLHPALCEDISILNVSVRAKYNAQNSDALDLESCRRAIVRGCMFDVGDDGICLKSFKNAAGRRIGVPTEDILIEDCVVFHAHGGLTIGSEMSGGVRNVRVDNCLFMGTDIGLRFKTTRGRGGVVENIFISNVNMIDIPGNAINFNMYYGGKAPLESSGETPEVIVPPVTEETPRFRDIHIENVVCRGANAAIFLQGLPEMPIQNITLKNVFISSEKGVFVTDADGVVFENTRVETQSGPPLTEVRVKNSKLELTQ